MRQLLFQLKGMSGGSCACASALATSPLHSCSSLRIMPAGTDLALGFAAALPRVHTVLSPSVVRVPLDPQLPVSFGTQFLALVHVEVQNQRVDLGRLG